MTVLLAFGFGVCFVSLDGILSLLATVVSIQLYVSSFCGLAAHHSVDSFVLAFEMCS